MTTSVNQWRIYCETESAWSSGFFDASSPAPTTCFNNTTHTVNANSAQLLQTISSNNVNAKIIEESIPTQGFFKSQGYSFTIPGNSTASTIVSWGYPVTVLETFFATVNTQSGDIINAITAPNTIIGTITANVAIGATVLPVSSTVVANSYVGFEILINGVLLGEILSIDHTNLTLTVSPLTTGYSSGAYVGVQIRIINNFIIGNSFRYVVGSSKIGGKFIAAGTTTRVEYTNNQSTALTFTFRVEFLF
jgi:hypothetical protein